MADDKKKELTERQAALIDALMGPAKGDIRAAMKIAGYSPNTNTMEVIKPIRDEVKEAAEMVISMNAPKAALGVVGVLDDPTALGAKNAVSAAKEVLDRAGVVKKEQVEVTAPKGAMFILPPKKDDE
jgi:spermidine/putrescine-binding protein